MKNRKAESWLCQMRLRLTETRHSKYSKVYEEICDRLCTAARAKSREPGIDISFAINDENGLPGVYRRYGEALVLSITLVAGGYPLFVNGTIAGGIGVGGGTKEQDCKIAKYIVSVFETLAC